MTSVTDAATWCESDLAALNGVGPRASAVLRAELAKQGLAFRHQTAQDEGAVAVQGYIDAQRSPQRETLVGLRDQVRRVLPFATEGIAYGLPAVLLQEAAIAGYGASATHCIYAPMSGSVLTTEADYLGGRRASRGVLQFGTDEKLPVGLLRRLVKARIAKVAAVTHGFRREYFPDGRVKAEGSMVKGDMHGPWFWHRADGSLLRTGHFRNGEQTGDWAAWSREADD